MAIARPHRKYALDEYVELERFANVKLEFAAGQVYAMSGGTPAHGVYAMNLARILGNALLDRPCRVQSADVKIRITAHDLSTYPDLSVVCGPAELDPTDRNAVVNPCLVVEVLSPGTEEYDRGDKLDAYKALPSVREILLVAHDAPRLELVQRAAGGTWTTATAGPGETLSLALGCAVAVDDVYRDRTS